MPEGITWAKISTLLINGAVSYSMAKTRHEVRDPIHGFVHFGNLERSLIDSVPYQRLREIHQLAMSYEVYPGACHTRFEHCLGVMEVAGRIFDSVFTAQLSDQIRDRISDELQPNHLEYWRTVLRLAALLHDIGHLPFSHAAEKALLPEGWDHERMTAEILRNSEIKQILEDPSPSVKVEDVIDVAWDFRKRKDARLTPWKTLLNEILTGNTFGADRIDYLLRDSYHVGVPYGRIDPLRLINGLRLILDPDNGEIALGVDKGSIHAAEALLLARYFMYVQVYFHDVRRIYDIHLKDFLAEVLPEGKFPTDWQAYVAITDSEILNNLRKSFSDPNDKLHVLATRVVGRRHFRTVYELVSPHKNACPTILGDVIKYCEETFGAENVRSDYYPPKSEQNLFWVITDGGSLQRASEISSVVANLPTFEVGLVFVDPNLKNEAKPKVDEFVRKRLDEAQNE